MTLQVSDLGRRPYDAVWQAMRAFTDERDAETQDQLWLVEHPPVFTQGQAGKPEHLLLPGDIPVVQTDRGGQVTYHGPGQLVAYPLLDLRRLGMGVRDLVTALEETLVGLLASYGVEAYPRPDAPGVYIAGDKVASLGLRVRRGCSFHGLALNVAMDLEPFRRINPCGYQGLQMTQLADQLTTAPDMAEVKDRLVEHFVQKIGYSCTMPGPPR
ncbi:lipoyl(octanoyl) transferase LipB [Marinimicrobium sp. C6131]|nr:lipoyl(octanoyl) transferase LipB [Marinimicrobium sp. C6131]UZJ46238.1 lipoyl(octanoyl) transferase LipB [Marinimicrobium sp. C6131]